MRNARRLADGHYLVTHYGEQNGDLMADPDMTFWKTETGDYFPASFRNDYMGISKESIIIKVGDNRNRSNCLIKNLNERGLLPHIKI